MDKLLLISILLMSIIIPIVTASDANPRRGLKRCVVGFCLFTAFWVFALIVIYPRLLALAS